MPKRPGHYEAGSDTGSVHQRLARLLETSQLARVVPHLAPETLHQLIRYRGLDASGELIASATPEQLRSVLDLDLWHSTRAGHDEQLDQARFGEWIESLVDAGGPFAARTVAAMDEHLVTAGLARYVRVFDLATLGPAASSDDEPFVDLKSADSLSCEVGGYLVRSTQADAWDAIVTLLLELDADHHDYFHSVMRGCRSLSNSTPELSGFDDLLLEREQQLLDVALARESRRTRQGYMTPADARAYLQMARRSRHPGGEATPSTNPFVAAYFRADDEATASAAHSSPVSSEAADAGDVAESIDDVVGLLGEAGLVPGQPRALLEGAEPRPTRLARLRGLMDEVRDHDEAAYLTRTRELAFLANTLMAGCSLQSRPFTAQEASDAVASTCNLGLDHLASPGTVSPGTLRANHSLVSAFEAGWAVLYEHVSLFVAQQCAATVADLRCADADIARGLYALRRELVRQHDAGTPWQARGSLEVIALLDTPAWAALLGLLDECPMRPAALTAVIEGHTGAVSATAFEFISTIDQIDDVRTFVKKLPDLLLR